MREKNILAIHNMNWTACNVNFFVRVKFKKKILSAQISANSLFHYSNSLARINVIAINCWTLFPSTTWAALIKGVQNRSFLPIRLLWQNVLRTYYYYSVDIFMFCFNQSLPISAYQRIHTYIRTTYWQTDRLPVGIILGFLLMLLPSKHSLSAATHACTMLA